MNELSVGRCEFNPMQAMILDHWHELAGDGVPSRASLNPGRFTSALGNISIVERAGDVFRFRLTGSMLKDIFKGAGKGHLLTGIDAAVEEAGSASMALALETRRAVFGDRAVGTKWHSWLRLPLMDEAGQTRLVLCFDEIATKPSKDNLPLILHEVKRRRSMVAA